MGGGQSKSQTITETLNTKINNIVNESVNNMETRAISAQKISVKCTPEQLRIANETYNNLMKYYQEALESYYKYGSKGSPPKEPVPLGCYLTGIKQTAKLLINVNSSTKEKLESDIKQKLDNEAQSLMKLEAELPAIGYSDIEIQAITQIKNNIINNTYSKTLKETINIAISEQEITSDGTTIIGVEQNNAINLIASSLSESLIKGVDQSVIKNSSETIAEMKQTSGLTNIFTGFFDTVGGMFNTLGGIVTGVFQGMVAIYIIIILVIVGILYLVGPCKIATIIPLFRFLCSTKQNDKNSKKQSKKKIKQKEEDENDNYKDNDEDNNDNDDDDN